MAVTSNIHASHDTEALRVAKEAKKRVDIHVRWNEVGNIMAIAQHTVPQLWEYMSVALSAGPLASKDNASVRDRAAQLNMSELQATVVDVLIGLPKFEMPEYLGDTFLYFFGASILIALVYPILAARALRQIKRKQFGVDKNGRSLPLCSFDGLVNTLLDCINEGFYFGIMVTLLSVFACSWERTPAAAVGGETNVTVGSFTLLASSSTKCFSLQQPQHMGYMLAGAVALLAFYPLATLLAPNFQFQNRMLDVKYNQAFLIMEHQFDLMVAGTSVFFEELNPLVVYVLVIFICLVLALSNHYMEPCLVYRFNYIKTFVFIQCAATALACLAYELAGKDRTVFVACFATLTFLTVIFGALQAVRSRRTVIIAKPRHNSGISHRCRFCGFECCGYIRSTSARTLVVPSPAETKWPLEDKRGER